METNKICKYCKLELQVCISEGLVCTVCSESIHLKCLEKGTVPGELNGDVFYTFTCKECSPTNEEVFLREALHPLKLTALVLYNLRTKNIYLSKRGYFHFQNHILKFIEGHWDILFAKSVKNKQSLLKAIVATLSHCNTIFFQSGAKVLAEHMYWTLKYPKLTPSAIWNIYSMFSEAIKKSPSQSTKVFNSELFERILQEHIQDKTLLVTFDDESSHITDKDSPIAAQESSTISERKKESTEKVSLSPKLSSSIEDDSFGGPSTSYNPLSQPVSAPESSTVPKLELRSTKTTSSSPKLSDSCNVESDSFSGPSTSYKALSEPASASKSSTVAKRKLRSTKTTSSSPKLSDSRSVEGDSFSGPSTSYKALSDPASLSKSSTVAKRKLRSTKTTSSSPKLSDSCSVEGDSFSGPSTSYNPLSDPASASKSATISERKRRNTGMMSSSPSKLFKSYSNEDKPLSRSAPAARTLPITEHERRRTEMMSSSPKLSSSIEDDSLSVPSTSSASESSTVPKRKLTNTKTTSSSRKSLDFRSVEGDSFSGPSTSYNSLSEPASASKSATIPERKRRNTVMMSSSPSKLSKSYSNKDKPLSRSSSAARTLPITEHERRSTEMMSSSQSKLSNSCSNEDDLLDRPTSYEPSLSSEDSSDYSSDFSTDYSSDYDSTPSLLPAESTSAELLDQIYYFNTCMSSVSKVRRVELITKLMGGYRRGLIKSPYSGIFLKPYIWRDTETFPTWLQLMCQVQLKSNQHIEDYVVPPRASVDYAYVQPEHIPAVNSLCNRFFWLGIDLSESLRYPEFSCIVLYKRLIVAFAFIIPNVSHTEHYLSYIFTRPGWRRVGIAKHMLYFLIKNSAGKDVTLHVSLDNVAYSMYHKFGFKVERIERNFYEKYIRTGKESKDALFCRRERSHSGDI